MKIPKPYFTHVPYIGDLEFKYCFYYLERPMLFVCMDSNKFYYLCSCYEIAPNIEWIIAKVSNGLLLRMIFNEISLANVFQQCNDKYIAVWRNGYEHESIKKVANFNNEILPVPDTYLDMEDNEYGDFIELLMAKQYNDTQYDNHINKEINGTVILTSDYAHLEYENDVNYKEQYYSCYKHWHNIYRHEQSDNSNIPVKYNKDNNTDYNACLLIAS
jgi:hypothetical protein